MKDTPVKPTIALPLPIKSKPGPKKGKMAAKKLKEHKTPIMKVGRSKKGSNIDKKSKPNKDNSVPEVKRKRGRPRNADRLLIKKPVKEQKSRKKSQERKTPGRKRKINPDSALSKEFIFGHLKRPKINDNNCSINGDIKLPISISKPFVQKGESPVVDQLLTSSAVNSNGTLHNKKLLTFGQKKSPLSILKSATFQIPPPIPPKKELLNGNGSLPSFKFQTNKNKTAFKKDLEINSSPKEPEHNSKIERVNNFSLPPNEALSSDPSKGPSKETKLFCKDLAKPQSKEIVKYQEKDSPKPPVKEPAKTFPKEGTKLQVKDCVKPQVKDLAKFNLNKPQEPNKSQPKDPVKPQPKDPVKPLFKNPIPIKTHPVRMASLDAMAKMHVICTTDRKPPEPKHSVAAVSPQRACSHQKSVTHQRIQFDVKKETNGFKGNIVHKQQINFVKAKQVFVSHSVQHSSIVEHEQSKTVSAKTQPDKEKKKKVKLPEKKTTNNKKIVKGKEKKSPSSNLKVAEKDSKSEKCKSKGAKPKETQKKIVKVPVKTVSKATKAVKEKPDAKSNCISSKKLEQTKAEVKVKKTIRLQKTCTYQTVTTVNTHGTTNTSVVPVGHVGLTTNLSNANKTLLNGEECKNKVNYSSGSVINNSYCLTTESPCSVGSHTDCCKFRAHRQLIPLAHVQACSLGQLAPLNRTTSDPSSSAPNCDGSNFPIHRFGHQQPLILTPSEYGYCCSPSIVQNVRDSCLLRKSIVAYPHLPSPHTHLPAYSSDAVFSDCRSSNPSVETQRQQTQRFTISSAAPSRVACCTCCELHRESNQQNRQPSLHFVSQPKTSSSLVPCEQSPLDLSLTSATSNINVASGITLPQGHCSSPLCRRDLLFVRTAPQHFQHNTFATRKPCCRCGGGKHVVREAQAAVGTVQSLTCSNNKSILKVDQPLQLPGNVTLLASPHSQASIPPIPSTSGLSDKSVPRVITDDSLVTAKQETNLSPKQSSKTVTTVSKKSVFAHGWSWKGKAREKLISLTNDSAPYPRTCYPSVQHKEGDTINERDCVLLRSGPKDTDLPYVAKIAAFWENPEDGEMMMSLLWYYRPEHTDQGRKPGEMEDEVFASRHKDVNSVACIEDKCYVLTFNEYCRYKASLSMDDDLVSLSSVVVPQLPDGYSRKGRLPCEPVSQDIVFFCRHVYDFRQKRILKNPT